MRSRLYPIYPSGTISFPAEKLFRIFGQLQLPANARLSWRCSTARAACQGSLATHQASCPGDTESVPGRASFYRRALAVPWSGPTSSLCNARSLQIALGRSIRQGSRTPSSDACQCFLSTAWRRCVVRWVSCVYRKAVPEKEQEFSPKINNLSRF